MTDATYKMIRNNIIGSVILTILLHVTGVLPYLIEFVFSIFSGDSEAAVSYAAGMPGLVIGFLAAVLGILIALSPIIIAVLATLYILKNRATD